MFFEQSLGKTCNLDIKVLRSLPSCIRDEARIWKVRRLISFGTNRVILVVGIHYSKNLYRRVRIVWIEKSCKLCYGISMCTYNNHWEREREKETSLLNRRRTLESARRGSSRSLRQVEIPRYQLRQHTVRFICMHVYLHR